MTLLVSNDIEKLTKQGNVARLTRLAAENYGGQRLDCVVALGNVSIDKAKRVRPAVLDKAIAYLVALTDDAEPATRSAAIRTLAAPYLRPLPDGAVGVLMAATRDGNESVRVSVVGTLGQLWVEKACPANIGETLVACLGDSRRSVRETACSALKDYRVARLGPIISETAAATAFRLLDDADESVRTNAASALEDIAKYGRFESSDHLWQLSECWLGAPTAEAIGFVMQCLMVQTRYSDPVRIVPYLEPLLRGATAPGSVPLTTVASLLKLSNPAADRVLIDALQAGALDEPVMIAAVEGVSRMNTIEAQRALTTALSSPNTAVRMAVLKVLAPKAAKVPEIWDAVMLALRDSDPIVRRAAVNFASKAEKEKVFQVLPPLLSDHEASVQTLVAGTLAGYGWCPGDSDSDNAVLVMLGTKSLGWRDRLRYYQCLESRGVCIPQDGTRCLAEGIAVEIRSLYARTRTEERIFHGEPIVHTEDINTSRGPVPHTWEESVFSQYTETVHNPDIPAIRAIVALLPLSLREEVRKLSGEAKYLFADAPVSK